MKLNKLSSTDLALQLTLALVFSTASGTAHADETVQATNIVRPQPDPNGVDLVSGGMYIPEMSLEAPGASKLQLVVARNEQGNEINSLYSTLSAQELDPFGDGADWPRLYSVVVDGISVRFECSVGVGYDLMCDELTPRRGAVLDDVNGSYGNGYIFTAPDGTQAEFPTFPFEPEISTPLESLYILFPSGEKISFQSSSVSGTITRTWTSNLGYSVITTHSGGNETRRLYKGAMLLNTITTSREDVSGGTCSSYTRRVTDDLGRNIRVRYFFVQGLQWDWMTHGIAWFEDRAGLRTTIAYYGANSPCYYNWSPVNSLPVSTLVRNSKTWSYSPGAGGYASMHITDPLGAVREVVSEPANASNWGGGHIGNIVSSMAPLGQTTSFEYYNVMTSYMATDHLASVTFPEGNKFKYTYDDRGNLTETRAIPKTGGPGYATYQASYPGTCSNRKTCNQPTWTRDSAGGQTDYTYDPTHGGLLTKLGPVDGNGLRLKIWNEYEARNTGNGVVYRISAVHDCSIYSSGTNNDCQTAAEQVTRFTYLDNTFLVLTETRTNGVSSASATTTHTYDAWGHVLSITDPTGVIKYFRFDIVGRKTWEVSANGAGGWVAQKYTYDLRDNLTRIDRGTLSDPISTALVINGSTINTFDTEGQQIKSEFVDTANGRLSVEQTSYDAVARPLCTVRRMNPVAFDSTADACAVGPSGPFGADRVTKSTYDLNGRLKKAVEGFGVMNGGLGIPAVEIDYTANDQIAWRRDGKGNQTTYTYDSYDRLDRTTFADSSFEKSEYDSASRLWKFTKRNGQWLTHGYDSASRLTSTTFSNGEPSVLRGYDGQGRPTTVSRGGQTITEVWGDPLGRLSSEIQPTGSVLYSYDLAGRKTRITWPGSYWVDYDYNSAGSLWRVRELSATAGWGVIATWTFDSLGRRATLTRPNGTTTSYTRDAADRLMSLSHDSSGTTYDPQYQFARNPASQIVSRTSDANSYWVWLPPTSGVTNYSPDALNRYSSIAGAAISYDGSGNLTNDGSRTYAYDFLNHLTSVSGGGSPWATLAYDSLNRLHAYSVEGVTTRFLYDGLKLIAEYDGSGNLLARHVPGPTENMTLVSLVGSALAANAAPPTPTTARWQFYDERGSVISLTNPQGWVGIQKYGPYGEPAASNFGRFGYTGQLWLPEIGLYHFKTRAYNPKLGRFMQADPVGYADGLNLYAYVRNDPLNFFDPTGTEARAFPYRDPEERTPDPRPEDEKLHDFDVKDKRQIDCKSMPFVNCMPMDPKLLDIKGAVTVVGVAVGVRWWARNLAAKAVPRIRGPAFDDLKDHATRHSALHPNAYYNAAVRHLGSGTKFTFRHDGQFKNAFVTRTGPDSFTFTSASRGGDRIFTHIDDVSTQYLRNIGITLPKGF